MGAALWIPDYLAEEGCRLRVGPGFETRGKPGLAAACVVCHHIGIAPGPRVGDAPGLGVVTLGRPGLRNCLCNVHLSFDGVATAVAAGVAWHAGAGSFRGLAGNHRALGVEAEGTNAVPMGPRQRDGYERVVAGLLRGLRREEDWACTHARWAPARKTDPWALIHAPGGFDGFRAAVARLLDDEEIDMAAAQEIMAAIGRLEKTTEAALAQASAAHYIAQAVSDRLAGDVTRRLQYLEDHGPKELRRDLRAIGAGLGHPIAAADVVNPDGSVRAYAGEVLTRGN